MPLEGLNKAQNLFSTNTLSGGLSYFDYEVTVAQEILIPWLSHYVKITNAAIGDFGCHQGGVLQAFRDARALSGKGFDLDAPSITQSPFQSDERFSLHIKDVLSIDPVVYQFDLILIRDVLEHIPNYVDVLKLAKQCLKPKGKIFISFPPYFSPFGGHQQEASNWVRFIPFLHYLPNSLFFSLVKTQDSLYMSKESSLSDMQSVAATKMTLHKAECAFKEAGLHIAKKSSYCLRPEFKVRYGIPEYSSPFFLQIPILQEVTTMGVYYLLINNN